MSFEWSCTWPATIKFVALALLVSSTASADVGCFKPSGSEYKCPDPTSYVASCKSTNCEVSDYDNDGFPDELTCSRDGQVGATNWASPEELLISFPKMIAATPGESGAKIALWEDFVICADIEQCHGCWHNLITDDYTCGTQDTIRSVIVKLNLTDPCAPDVPLPE